MIRDEKIKAIIKAMQAKKFTPPSFSFMSDDGIDEFYKEHVKNLVIADSDNILKIYHGTIIPFDEINVEKGEPLKDFGRGFYCGKNYNQAKGLAEGRKAGKVKLYSEGLIDNHLFLTEQEYASKIGIYLYTYLFDANAAYKLEKEGRISIKQFLSADVEWFDFIIHNRATEPTVHKYDIVIGPTADDATSLIIRRYLTGRYDKTEPEKAKYRALKDLKTEKLGIQYYFKTPESIKLLKRVKEEIIDD